MSEPNHASLRAEYVKGLAIATVGVIVLSFDALLIRLAGVSGLKATFWRALFTGISLAVVFFVSNRSNAVLILKRGGKTMWISGVMWGFSGLGFTMGVITAGAANTLVLVSLAPLFAAAFGFIAYRQKPSWVTLLAAVGALLGIAFMYRNGFGDLTPEGLLFTLATPSILGSNLAYLRRHRDTSRVAVCMIGGFVGAAIALVFTLGHIAIPMQSILPLGALGLIAIPFSQTMISTGTRYIPAAESALVNSLETVLGIAYVWLFLGERPDADFIFGALVVMGSITANSLYQARVRKVMEN